MRYLYTLFFYLAMPFILIRLIYRSFKQREYAHRLAERFGVYPNKLNQCIWIHAVSVGETLAALPLIKALLKHFPQLPIVVTTMTPTGAARIKAQLGNSVMHAYIPYDLPGAIKRFLKAFNPQIGIIMETELWPNLVAICSQKKVPLALVNARLSKKSAKNYRRIAWFTNAMLQKFTMIAANGKADAKRLIALGAFLNNVTVTGNIKFDLELPKDLAMQSAQLQKILNVERFIWIAASTHEGEETVILQVHQKIREHNPHALLILVPRNPDRFDSVFKLCEQSFVTARRSQASSFNAHTSVYLGDTMGELLLFYHLAQLAFVGGSLVPHGGHNILEPGSLGKAIITGPHCFNFSEINELFMKRKALIKVSDAKTLTEHILRLMNDHEERMNMGERALKVMAENRGALAKQLSLITNLLSQKLL